MDGVGRSQASIEMGRHGGLAVLNLEGIFSRYAIPTRARPDRLGQGQEEATKIIQSIYSEPIKKS